MKKEIYKEDCNWCEYLGYRTVSVETEDGGGEIIQEECEVCKNISKL